MPIIFVFSIPGRQRDPLLRDHPRASLRPLHQHVPDAGPPARHRDDEQARLRRLHLRDLQVLQTQQQRVLSDHPLRRAKEVGAVPGGPLPGHAGRRAGAHGGPVVQWDELGPGDGAF